MILLNIKSYYFTINGRVSQWYWIRLSGEWTIDGEHILTYHALVKVIAHVDADCFYVSCERMRDASLNGIPVGVLGNQGACIIAGSYELKARGVKVAMPIWQAKKLCPEAVYVKRDFAWYESVSVAMHKILKRYSDVMEFYSIDECFLDLTGVKGDWKEFAYGMQKDVKDELGLPISVGIAGTRSLAKIGSDKNKPFGVSIINDSNLHVFLESTPVGEICGIGGRLERRLHALGIYNCLQYVRTSRKIIKRALHKPGEEIWYELQGKSLLPVRTVRPQRKVISRGGQIPGRSSDKEFIYALLIRNLERLTEALWHYNVEILNLRVILVKGRDAYCIKNIKLHDYSAEFSALQDAVSRAFFDLYDPSCVYSAMHLIGSPVRSRLVKQMNLFEVYDSRKHTFEMLKQSINDRFGSFTVRSASTASARELFRDPGSDKEICDIEGKFCF